MARAVIRQLRKKLCVVLLRHVIVDYILLFERNYGNDYAKIVGPIHNILLIPMEM